LPNPTFHSLSYVIFHDAMLFQKLLHTSQFVTCIAIELKRFIIFPWSCFWQRGVSFAFSWFSGFASSSKVNTTWSLKSGKFLYVVRQLAHR
jgi:hypothetical protein